MALRKFIYLDDASVRGYVSTLEDGLREEVERSRQSDKGLDASIGISGTSIGGNRSKMTGERQTLSDTPESRFHRFHNLATEAGELEVVLDADGVFPTMTSGQMIQIDSDVFIPEIVRMLARSGGGGSEVLDMIETFRPLADTMGLEGIPSAIETGKYRSMIDAMATDQLMVVGELDDTEWKIAGQLDVGNLKGGAELDDFVTVVGKVKKILPEGRTKPLLALPGMTLMSRAKRREMEAQAPKPGEEDNYLFGPALILDVLAIFS